MDHYYDQANVCHAYQLLVKQGINKDNIVTMMFDDIAYNAQNPFPGIIYNYVDLNNVYAGMNIDYKNSAVSLKNFKAVLSGKNWEVDGGTGRVLKTGYKDRIFLYIATEGGSGSININDDVLTASELEEILSDMYDGELFDTMVFYLDADNSATMFGDYMEKKSIYGVSSTMENEENGISSCGNGFCLFTNFARKWLLNTETTDSRYWVLERQYDFLKSQVYPNHPQQFGDLSITNSTVMTYMGNSRNYSPYTDKK